MAKGRVHLAITPRMKLVARLAYMPIIIFLERVTGIEPVSLPWQGNVITIIRYPLKGRDARYNLADLTPGVNRWRA